MNIDEELKKIFEDDELGLLEIKPKVSNQCSQAERLQKSFDEINAFIDKNGKLPKKSGDVLENNLYFRLQGILEDSNKMQMLKALDRHNLFNIGEKTPETIDDIFNDDEFDLLSDDTDIFKLKHVQSNRQQTDFIAHRKSCKNFQDFEKIFIKCHEDIKNKIRKFEKFAEPQIEEGQMFLLNGMLMYVNKLFDVKKISRGYEIKYDGRTHLIFENGTDSNMRFRSLCKRLFENGKHITNTVEDKMKKFQGITEKDKLTGFIYVLESKSKDEKIRDVRDLYKIGYCETTVTERIKNAQNEPTYLMAPVKIVAEYKTFNMNTQKFENLLHRFFGHCCVSIDVFDNNGTRHTPQEWFQIPYDVINKAIRLIITGEIVNYKYDRDVKMIVEADK